METPTIQSLRKKRGALKRKLTDFSTFLDTLRDKTLTREQEIQLDTRLNSLLPLLENLDILQNQILQLDTSEDSDVDNGSAIEKTYYQLIADAKLLLEVSQQVDDSENNKSQRSQVSDNGSEMSYQSNTNSRSNVQHIKLPTISLPKFDGQYIKWLEFHDTFLSLIHENESLSNIQRFHYLKASLIGDATEIVKSLQLTSDNYSIAWKLLCDRYTNKKLLLQNHLRDLFNLKECNKESAAQLREMLDVTTRHLRSLEALGQPIEHWDSIIIYLIVSKFDKVTARDWELTKTEGEIATLIELKKFLSNKADMLDNLDLRETKTAKFIQKPQKSFVSSTLACYHCKESHAIYICPKFLSLPSSDRIVIIKNLKLCLNCLRPNHKVEECNSRSGGCKLCKKKHNTLLHNEGTVTTASNNQNENTKVPTTVALSSQSLSMFCHVLLPTALIQVQDSKGNLHMCRAILDSASQSNFITEAFHSKLGLTKSRVNISVEGINQTVSEINYRCAIHLSSRIKQFHIETNCLIKKYISESLPSVQINPNSLNIPDNIQLADPHFTEPSSVDMLIGAPLFLSLLTPGQISLGKNLPVLQNTHFGWIASGPISSQKSRSVHCYLSSNITVQDQLQRFWELEECPKHRAYSLEQQLCESLFCQNLEKDPSGKYIVSLPLKDSPCKLGDSRHTAEKRLLSMEKKLNLNSQLKDAYIQFMTEYESLGHMSPVLEENDNQVEYFLPHHVVVNQTSKTTKHRVVFDGSCPTSSGVSINDLQLVGPTVQDDLFQILIRFRQHTVAFSADVQKMYRQVLVKKEHRPLQRILWRYQSSDPIQVYELNTVTYGTASAPFLATRCLIQVANEHMSEFPAASSVIKADFYVDDILSGGDNPEEVSVLCNDIKTILNTIHFHLHKWVSNVPDMLPSENNPRQNMDLLQIGSGEMTKTLGLHWSPHSDTLNYKIHPIAEGNLVITKRHILSEISQIFDPLGLLSACIIIGKIMLQELWHKHLNWDDPLPSALTDKWLKFRRELSHFNEVKISRHAVCLQPVRIELHCFSDASEKAYAAGIYLRSENKDGTIQVHLLCAKGKVAPLKKTTIPRLELCAAHLGAKLMTIVKDSLRLNIDKVYMWCDSTIVLGWLKTSPHLLKVFVSHRVADIQSKTYQADWGHVSTHDNPADVGSRGIFPSELQKADIWWKGPAWLSLPSSKWPIQCVQLTDSLPEVKRVEVSLLSVTCRIPIDFLKFSNYNRLLRTLSFCLRFISNCKKYINERIKGTLAVNELDEAFTLLIKTIQGNVWGHEIQRLKLNNSVSLKSDISSLNPFLDSNDMLRVGGRLQSSNLEFDQKHQILLPKHHVTKLLFKWEHEQLGHAGPQLLIASIRNKFWPLGARNYARQTVHYCKTCFKFKPVNLQPIMGNLPHERVRPSMPFQFTGVDYAGPVSIRDRKGRGYKVLKSYIAIFICFAVKAVHVELVSSLNTESFLAAFKRFIARRGKPTKMYSDNATNFVGANRELKELYDFIHENVDTISETLSVDSITWSFIPPNSPNFGGLWEAAVKSVKFHLKRVVGDALLTFEQLTTVLAQVECILNSRPITPLSNDPNDFEPLTPSHFLIGRPMTALPEQSVLNLPVNRLSEYQRIQQIVENFWNRWKSEYLQTLQSRKKWQRQNQNIKIGAMVLLQESATPPCHWPLGRIVEVFPGQDDIIRVVTVRTAKGIFKRAIGKIYPLPSEDDPSPTTDGAHQVNDDEIEINKTSDN